MRTILYIMLCLSIPVYPLAQSKYDYKHGYKYIKKASKSIKHHHLNRAEKLLNKARKCNYGFCGNAWASAFENIKLMQVEIFNKRMEYQKALILLDSMDGCGFGADCKVRDSLKVQTLLFMHGKEKVTAAFKNLKQVTITQIDFINNFSFYLTDLNYHFNYATNIRKYIIIDGNQTVRIKTEEDLLAEIKQKFLEQLGASTTQ